MPARARLQALKLLLLAGLLSWLVAGLSRGRGSSPPAPSPAPSPTRPTLTELANRFKSDKGTSFQAGHDYARIYQELFPRLRVSCLLELGLNVQSPRGRDSRGTPSLEMWRAWFPPEVEIVGFDILPDFAEFRDPARRIDVVIGDQSSPEDLRPLLSRRYDLILDDAHHASRHQQVSLQVLWGSLNPGGVYILEDLHYQPEPEEGPTTRDMLRRWARGERVGSPYLSEEVARRIGAELDRIELYDSASPQLTPDQRREALGILYKRGPARP